jgi:hypothetical protein
MPFVGNMFSESFQAIENQVTFYGMLQGGGAGNKPVAVSTTPSLTSSNFMQASTNFVSQAAADITRSATGAYTAKFRTAGAAPNAGSPPVILDITISIQGTTGSGNWGTWSDYNQATGVLTFNVWAAGGAAVDLPTTDFVRFTFTAQNTTPFK